MGQYLQQRWLKSEFEIVFTSGRLIELRQKPSTVGHTVCYILCSEWALIEAKFDFKCRHKIWAEMLLLFQRNNVLLLYLVREQHRAK